jgi:hypothetical protein
MKIPIFFVVPDETRAANMLRLAAHEATIIGVDPSVFFVTTAHAMRSEVLMTGSIWQQPGNETPVAILPGTEEEMYESA